MAVFFGTSLAKSAFDVAFKIPNLFRRLFGEGALSAAFIPVFTESIEKGGLADANRLAARAMSMLGTALGVIVLGCLLLLTLALGRFGLGERTAAVLPLLRIMFPYMFFICMVALCMAILNSFHHFAVPAATPIILNLVWIGSLLWLCPRFGESLAERINGVAWGVLIAGVIQLAVQFPVLRRYGIRPTFQFGWRDERVRRVLLIMGPAALGMGVTQVNVCVDSVLAMAVGKWAPAALTYSERLIYLPLGVFATALGTVLLPTFSRQAAREQLREMPATLALALQNLMLVMIPAAVGLLVMSDPLVRLVFMWPGGAFRNFSAVMTARAVRFYAPGLVVFSFYKVLVPAFYAMQDSRTPVRIGLRIVGLNLALNILFVLTWPQGFEHAGLAFATVLSSVASCVALGVLLQRRVGSPGWKKILASGGRALVAALAMGIAARGAYELLAGGLLSGGRVGKLLEGAAVGGAIACGVLLYCLLLPLLCREEVNRLLSAVGKRDA